MYRIMLIASKRANYESLYKYLTTTIDGETSPAEFETKDALDKKVESMLNDEGYSKNDFIIVEELDYSIDAKISDESEDSGTTETDMFNYYTKDEVDELISKATSGSSAEDTSGTGSSNTEESSTSGETTSE